MSSPRRVSIVACLAICLLALLLQACGTGGPAVPATAADTSANATVSATPTPEPATAGKVGAPVVAGSTTITVSKVSNDSKLVDGQKARNGNTFVIADLQIENTGGDTLSYGQFDFVLKDAAGKQYSNVVSLDSHFVRQGDLAKGEKANGILAFEVGKDAKGLVLVYKRASGTPIEIQLQ
jgi:hypothetical protein